jgi:hypothetical protein
MYLPVFLHSGNALVACGHIDDDATQLIVEDKPLLVQKPVCDLIPSYMYVHGC